MPLPVDRLHWPRWSKVAFFKAIRDIAGIVPVYYEGDVRTTQVNVDFFEVRLTGPDIWQPSNGCWYLTCIFNVLVNTKEDPTDLYSTDRLTGQATDGFTDEISVFRLGTLPVDDGSYFGCYVLKSSLDINQFGVLDGAMRVNQTTIEGTYELQLDLT